MLKFSGYYLRNAERLSIYGLPETALNGLEEELRVIGLLKKKRSDSFRVQNRRSQTECTGQTSAQADAQSALLKPLFVQKSPSS